MPLSKTKPEGAGLGDIDIRVDELLTAIAVIGLK